MIKLPTMDLRKSPVPMDPSIIPTDITFVIEQCGSVVEAHKFVMAMGSPVFLDQFYGNFMEALETIVHVKEATRESFVTMVYFLYGKEIDWKGLGVVELFEVANMAEKYDIDTLMEAVNVALQDYPLNEANVVACATCAVEFGQFEETSETFLLRCSKFLKSALPTEKDFDAFAAKYAGDELSETAFKLMQVLSQVVCVECYKETCRRGKLIANYDEIQVGDKVMFKPEAEGGPTGARSKSKQGVVIRKDCGSITVKLDGGESDGYYVIDEEIPKFMYSSC